VARIPYFPFGFNAYTGFFENRQMRLGDREDLDRSLELWSAGNLFERLPRLVDSILLLVLAIFLFALYFAQKGHIEYLWLALHELLQAPISFFELSGSSARLDSLWYAAIILELMLISIYLYFEFLIAFLALRPKRRWVRWFIRLLRYTAPILAAVGPTWLLVGHNRASTIIGFVFAFSVFWVFGWLIFIFSTLIVATMRRNFEAGLLLIPLVLSGIGIMEPIFAAGMSDWSGHAYNLRSRAGRPHSHPLRFDRRFHRHPGHRPHHLCPLPAHPARPGTGVQRTGCSAQRSGTDDPA
jgi:hypothetical protein